MVSTENQVTPKRSQTADSTLINNTKQDEPETKRTKHRLHPIRLARSTSLYRANKLYRSPPTPPPQVQFEREQDFVLDCNAVSNISNDYSTANPKLGSVIPPYNAQHDHHVDGYFRFFGIHKTLKKTGQFLSSESIAGRVHDRFYTTGHGFEYLERRNKFGSGHSIDEVRGHELFLSDPKPIVNYNGVFGYRRNTPSFRRQPAIGIAAIGNRGVIPVGRFSGVGCGRSYTFHCRCKFDQPCRCHNQDKLCPCVKT